VYERLGDIDGEAAARWRIARILLKQGSKDEAAVREIFEHLDRAFRLNLQLGRPDGIAAVGLDLGQVLEAAGAVEPARQVYTLARDAARKIGWREIAEFCEQRLQALPPPPDQNAASGLGPNGDEA